MAAFTKLCLYDKTMKTIPRQGYNLLILHIQYWLLRVSVFVMVFTRGWLALFRRSL